MLKPERHGRAGDSYSYGFQGQLHDDELNGEGNSVNYKYRMHDPRIGRFFEIDPLSDKYPHNSPYAFSENRVIDGVELEGLEYYPTGKGLVFMDMGELFLKAENFNYLKLQSSSRIGTYVNHPHLKYTGAISAGKSVTPVLIKDPQVYGPDGSAQTKNQGTQRTTEQALNDNRRKTNGTQFDNRQIVYQNSARSATGAGVVLILNVALQIRETYFSISSINEQTELSKQKTLVFNKIIKVINYGLENNFVTEEFLTEENFSDLFNAILDGGDGKTPQHIKELGKFLYEQYEGTLTELSRNYDEIELDKNVQKADNVKVKSTIIRQ